MNLAYTAYKLFSSFIFLPFLPLYVMYSVMTGQLGQRTKQRLGLYPQALMTGIRGAPRIWIHAVSVGEAGAAVAIVDALTASLPDCAIILSTTTEAGQIFAKENMPDAATCIYAPFDFIPSVRSALNFIRPDILVLLETELWPNLLAESRRRNIHTALLNGRISVRSIRNYLKIRPFMRAVLKHVEIFCMISQADAQRIQSIGAATEKIITAGNAKYDPLLQRADEHRTSITVTRFNLNGNEPVFVAGSTHGNEEDIVLDVYEKVCRTLPETLLIIAPRHIERSREIEALVKQRGIFCQFRTDLDNKETRRTAPVVILDTIGELQTIYSIATVIFCGGSLIPLGGQNILEAAVWGKPVLYGPSMEDFQDARDLLDKTGGGIQVNNETELSERVCYYLNNPLEANRVGQRAKEAVKTHKGAARKHADAICRLLTGR